MLFLCEKDHTLFGEILESAEGCIELSNNPDVSLIVSPIMLMVVVLQEDIAVIEKYLHSQVTMLNCNIPPNGPAWCYPFRQAC